MLASTGSSLLRAASPKLVQLAGAAVASYHAIYDVGNSTNIKWCAAVGAWQQHWLNQGSSSSSSVSSTVQQILFCFPFCCCRHEGGVSTEQKEDMLSQKGCVLW